MGLRVGSDSTTALTMATRHGHGRAKHMQIQYMWVQEIVRSGRAEVSKIGTAANRADLLTKHLPRSRMIDLLRGLGYRLEKSALAMHFLEPRAQETAEPGTMSPALRLAREWGCPPHFVGSPPRP